MTEKEQILCHYGRMDRLAYYTGEKKLTAALQRSVEKALAKRRKGIPLGYILGKAPFYGRDFAVSPAVLIPRPETERLVEETLFVLKDLRNKRPSVLDLGTGSGCIAVSLTLEGPPCRMTALDASRPALNIARKNIKLFGLGQKIRLVHSKLFSAFSGKSALWDVIVSNPPYIPAKDIAGLSPEVRREPRLALDGGPEGLDVLNAILDGAPAFLRPNGALLMEIADGQAQKLNKIWKKDARYASLRFEKDLNGIERILIARMHGSTGSP